MPKISVVEFPNGLLPNSTEWAVIADRIAAEGADVLVTNEMPFGDWLPTESAYDHRHAADWVALHERGLTALADLEVGCVLSTRPVMAGGKLANEAFALEKGGYTVCHHKQYFPEEPGWHEESWFHPASTGFEVRQVGGIRVAFLVCTELMFNEHARAAGRAGADLIAAPRATGHQVDAWEVAARMAAITSGCYVASSNRRSLHSVEDPNFGGKAFAVAPGGLLLATTSDADFIQSFELDLNRSAAAKGDYPCYVKEQG